MKQVPEQPYYNRELSWLAFNNRVLEEARDKGNPLFERTNFLSITGSNLDEFFMVRVASLQTQMKVGINKKDISGLLPKQQLSAIYEETQKMVNQQYSTYSRMLKPLLKSENILISSVSDLSPEQFQYLERYFRKDVYPVLTPMAVDSSRPFPLIANKTINVAASMVKESESNGPSQFATVQVPSVLPRVISVPSDHHEFVLLEDVIRHFIGHLFAGYTILESICYRVIRDMDIEVEEEEVTDLLKEMKKQLQNRERGDVLRLDIEAGVSTGLLEKLKESFEVQQETVYFLRGPVDLTFLSKLKSMVWEHENLTYPAFIPFMDDTMADRPLFDQLNKRDILLHHPYDSFKPVVKFIEESARDNEVLAIKMTLYRVSGDSPIIKALEEAAKNGKQVTVLLELKARFDEENNINWAVKLEKAGCHVIYGLQGLKTHCKLTLVVRREDNGIKRYIHLGTGNYNDQTAKLYTDMSYFTANRQYGIDASAIFNMLSGYAEPEYLNKLIMAPYSLRSKLLENIDMVASHARKGSKAVISMKVNSLSDQTLIDALYTASQAGVHIRLIVRGICCLRPGVPNLSESIQVQSIVGRYLEHTRIFTFTIDDQVEVFLSSADAMPRNLDGRVEIMFPIKEEEAKQEVIHAFSVMWNDNIKTRVLQMDGSYNRVDRRGKDFLNAQLYFQEKANDKILEQKRRTRSLRPFVPLYGES